MGSKSASKDIMIRANVPVIPGYHGENQDIEVLRAEAKKIGYPVLIKAVLGGGGKGMRIVEREEDLEDSINSSKREAISSFGDDRVLVEKYLRNPRYPNPFPYFVFPLLTSTQARWNTSIRRQTRKCSSFIWERL